MRSLRKITICLALATVATSSASADPIILPINIEGPNGTTWQSIENDPIEGFRLGDASIAGLSNSFDGIFSVVVNGQVYAPGNSALRDVLMLSDGTLLGTKISALPVRFRDPQTQLEVLELKEDLLFYDSPVGAGSSTVRALISVENISTVDQVVGLIVLGNLGSDQDTEIRQTSDGNLVYDPTDRWIVTGSSIISTAQPVIGLATKGQDCLGSTALLGSVAGIGNDDLVVLYNLNIPAGKRRLVALFAQVSSTNADANNGIKVFDSLSAIQSNKLFADLNVQELGLLSNWPVLGCGNVGGKFWYDENLNGIFDLAETGLAGIALKLLDNQGQVAQSLTDADGNYQFSNVRVGAYLLETELGDQSAVSLSPKDRGQDDSKDSDFDPTSQRTDSFILNIGENIRLDGGVYIPGLVDTDRDGLPDIGDPCPRFAIHQDENENGILDCQGALELNVALGSIGPALQSLKPGQDRVNLREGSVKLLHFILRHSSQIESQAGKRLVSQVVRLNTAIQRATRAAKQGRSGFKRLKRLALERLQNLLADINF